jgi:2-(1,2-epoxy-1,2-dihydrophenyl)acetyl-CoA isomerase
MSEVLEVRDEGRLRILRLNRPDRKNALNGELISAFPRAIRAAAADDDVWAIAITGAGSSFCSGLDLEHYGDAVASDGAPVSAGDQESDVDGTHWAIHMRVECEKPIVAGINGVAVGAGVSLAMNADIRIAGPSARFHPGYARVATSPDFGLTWTLLRAVGYERAMRFLLEQRMVPADEALALGMVSEVVERDEDLEPRLLEYGSMLAGVAPLAARQTKRLLVALDRPSDLAGHLDEEIELALHGLGSADGAEAIRAILEGDTPNFTGE